MAKDEKKVDEKKVEKKVVSLSDLKEKLKKLDAKMMKGYNSNDADVKRALLAKIEKKEEEAEAKKK